MEVVSRIAVQLFNCRLVGGFIRDWVVRGDQVHPATPPSSWVEAEHIHDLIIPAIKEG